MTTIIGCTTRPYDSVLAFEQTCEHIAAAGYTDVAVFGKALNSKSSDDKVAGVRNAAANAGVAPSMLLVGSDLTGTLEHAVDDYKRLIDNATALGAQWLLDLGTGKEAQYANYFEMMRQVASHAQAAGIGITMKPHGGISLTVDDLIRANDQVDHPAFGICYDPGNIIYYTQGKLRPEPFVETIAPITSTFIIKDCVIIDGKPDVMVTPGNGLVDFDKVIGGLVANGFDGPCYLECVSGKTLEEIDHAVSASRVFIKQILQMQ